MKIQFMWEKNQSHKKIRLCVSLNPVLDSCGIKSGALTLKT